MVERVRRQIKIWQHAACWISKATREPAYSIVRANTFTHLLFTPFPLFLPSLSPHREICNTHCFSTTAVVSWGRLSVTLYVHYLSCKVFKSMFVEIILLCVVAPCSLWREFRHFAETLKLVSILHSVLPQILHCKLVISVNCWWSMSTFCNNAVTLWWRKNSWFEGLEVSVQTAGFSV
jgi:hypothetical protein